MKKSSLIEQNYYNAELSEWKEKECTAAWLIHVSREHGNVFTVEFANKIIDFANEKYKEKFGKNVSFQKLKIDLTEYMIDTESIIDDGVSHPKSCYKEKIGTYDKRTNILRIWVDGLPVYENNNGKICKDSSALADCLM